MRKIISLLSFLIVVLVSCEDKIEINVGNELDAPSNFQVDFEGKTFIADVAIAYIYEGTTTIIAKKLSTNEVVVISLHTTEVGSYLLLANENIGSAFYRKEFNNTFLTKTNALSGTIDINSIDLDLLKLSGNFNFIGTKFTQQFDALGNPVIDLDSKLVYDEQEKEFSNGIFNNIVLVLGKPEDISINPETNDNKFFVNLDGDEYIERIVTAHKSTFDTFSYITIEAKRDGLEEITLKIPLKDLVTGNYQIKDAIIVGDEVIGYYIFNHMNYYTIASTGTNLLSIKKHNITTKTIEGTFSFDTTHLIAGEVISFTDGTFEVTYTE